MCENPPVRNSYWKTCKSTIFVVLWLENCHFHITLLPEWEINNLSVFWYLQILEGYLKVTWHGETLAACLSRFSADFRPVMCLTVWSKLVSHLCYLALKEQITLTVSTALFIWINLLLYLLNWTKTPLKPVSSSLYNLKLVDNGELLASSLTSKITDICLERPLGMA